MDGGKTEHERDPRLKACAELCRKGTCDMTCIGTGRQWCAGVEEAVRAGR